jgi:hypothetical protein
VEKPLSIDLGNDFLDITLKSQAIKANSYTAMEAKLKGNLIDHEKYLQSTYLIWVRYPK